METNVVIQNDPLWKRIQDFSPDHPDADFPFSRKLGKEHGWTVDFTLKAIDEYKKFVYLCCRVPGGASPSPIVDKVWHMHLIYTRNYWEEFCPDVLHQKLHHHPSTGGKIDKAKHRKWYEDTLENYRMIFGKTPPEEIWADHANNSTSRNALKTNFKILVFVSLVFIVNSCSDDTENILEAVARIVVAVLVVGWFIASIFIKNKNSGNNNDGGSCSGSSNCGSSCTSGCGGGCGGCGGD